MASAPENVTEKPETAQSSPPSEGQNPDVPPAHQAAQTHDQIRELTLSKDWVNPFDGKLPKQGEIVEIRLFQDTQTRRGVFLGNGFWKEENGATINGGRVVGWRPIARN